MLFAYTDANGRITDALNDDTVESLPDGARELTQEQFDKRFDLVWTSEGWDESQPADGAESPKPLAKQVSRFQLLGAMLELGVLDKVQTWANTSAEPLNKLALDTSPVFSTDSQTISILATAMAWDDAFVAQIFQTAATVQA